MKTERESNYLFPAAQTDNPDAWLSGMMHTGCRNGLADDGYGDTQMISVTPSGDSTNWADVFKTALPAIATAYQQDRLLAYNMARINSNQPPLTSEQMRMVTPTARVEVGATSDMQKLMLYGALGVAALIGLRAAKVI